MPWDSDLDELAGLSVRARAEPEWARFADFAEARSKGLRGDAFRSLNVFLDESGGWDYPRQLRFTRWLLEASLRFSDRALPIPHPLSVRLVVPVVRQWCDREPEDAQPRLWLGLLRCDDPSAHLEAALKLDPTCEKARQTLTDWALDDVEYNQHHLPDFYIHDPRLDLVELDRLSAVIDASADEEWAGRVREEIRELRCRAEEWLSLHPRPGDFAAY